MKALSDRQKHESFYCFWAMASLEFSKEGSGRVSVSSSRFIILLHPHGGVRKPSSGRVHSQGPFYSGQLVFPLNTSITGGAEKIVAPRDLRGSQSCSRQKVPLLEPMQPSRSTSGSHWKTRLVPAGLTPPVIVNASCVFIFPFIFLFRISTVPESFLSRVKGGI